VERFAKRNKKTGSGYVRHKGSTPHMTDNEYTMHYIWVQW